MVLNYDWNVWNVNALLNLKNLPAMPKCHFQKAEIA